MQVKGFVRPDDPLLTVSLLQLVAVAGAVIAASYALMGDLKMDLKAEIREVKQDLKADVRELKQEFKADVRELKKDILDIKAILQSSAKGS